MQRVNFDFEGTGITLFTHDPPDHFWHAISSGRNFYEMDLLQKARSLVRRGDFVIDVGANIGNHTLLFS